MDINSSDEHPSGVDSTLSQTEINEANLSDRTEPTMFPHATSLDLIPSSGQQEEGARPRDRQRQHSLPGRSTTAPLPPQQSETLAGDLKANYSQALPPPSVLQEQVTDPEIADGLEVNFLARHCQDGSILEDLQQQVANCNREQTATETCQHYKRKCFSWFACCEQLWPCHRCHNSRGCCKAEASNATHLKCSKCGFVQEIGNGATCQNCSLEMAAYFCSICKHLSNVDNEPYHCEKCGVCRSYRTKAFHCDICGLCMNRRFQDKHKCRPSSAHDKCCICLEDMGLYGCYVLSCSHMVHGKCYVQMRVLSDSDTCPICRQSISRSQRE